jgi:hypothetical protein
VPCWTPTTPGAALRETAARHLRSVDHQIGAATQLRSRLADLATCDDPPTELTLEVTAMTVALDRIVTRTGDDGSTAVVGGRLRKDDDRVEALGALDELKVAIGAALAATVPGYRHIADLPVMERISIAQRAVANAFRPLALSRSRTASES